MSYSDEVVKAKLSALNETQESIVTVAQWIMFHRRYADRTAALWLQKLKDSSASKRLNLIYLANEVVQQSKARKKDDFLIAFSPIIGEATASAYKGATSEVQSKLKRVVEVWRQRMIFEQPIQESVEARLTELDKSRGSGKKSLLGGSSLLGSTTAAPTELQPLISLQQAVTKAATTLAGTGDTTADYDSLMNSPDAPPSEAVHAARLSGLLKKLASAEGAVSESIKARRELIVGLEKLLETNRTALGKDESQHAELDSKKDRVEAKKRDVEDEILRKLPMESPGGGASLPNGAEPYGNGHDEPVEPARPQFEELTPPPVETLTPVGSPGNDYVPPEATDPEESLGGFRAGTPTPPAGYDFPAPGDYMDQDGEERESKKRKLDGAFGGFASGGIPGLAEDVDDLIKTEGALY